VTLDLDHFKRVNDERGHEAGDRALAMVGRVIADHVRGADLAARWGGEEFVVVLPGADAAAARAFAERVRGAVADSRDGLTLSAGVAVTTGPPDPRALLGAADAALYAAKRAGRDRTVVADGGAWCCQREPVSERPVVSYRRPRMTM
jgi:diguanylate cyclase (GGDEF)-like protein